MERDFIGEHEISPLARFFPRLSPKAYESFKGDIEKYGQKDPIARHRGLIIDGVHRLLASIELGKEPWIEDLDDSVDPVAYVSSKNNHRRDLDKDQKIIIAFRFSEESTSGRPPQEHDAHSPPFLTIGEAVDEFGVSRRSLEQARRVLKEGSPAVPELRQAVLDYLVKCSDAEKIINMPAEVQRRVVELKRSGQARTVTAAAKMVEDELRQEEDAEARQFNLALSLSETVTLLHSAVGDLHRQVEADSVDLILAFPPTDERNLPLFSDLAGFAAHALAPGGRMALLANAEFLPAILQRLTHDEVTWITELRLPLPRPGSEDPSLPPGYGLPLAAAHLRKAQRDVASRRSRFRLRAARGRGYGLQKAVAAAGIGDETCSGAFGASGRYGVRPAASGSCGYSDCGQAARVPFHRRFRHPQVHQ